MKGVNPLSTLLSILQNSSRFLWLLLAASSPLLINFWGQRPFALPKVLWVQTVVWSLAALLLVHRLLTPPTFRKRSMMTYLWPLLLLATVLLASTATSVDGWLSWWGSYHRSQGTIIQLTYLLLCGLAMQTFRTVSRARQLTAVLVLTGLPLILLGGAQALGFQPIPLITDARSAAFATLGRANFLAAYLLLLLPLTLMHQLSERHRIRRLGWVGLLIGQLGLIGLTQTRSAWIAIAVALLLFLWLGWGKEWSRRQRRVMMGLIALLAVSGPLFVWFAGPYLDGSAAARLGIWQGTMTLIGQRPFLGHGVETLGIQFPAVYPPSLVYVQGRDFFVDRAHNLLLDWTVTTGLAGLLAYLWVLGTFAMTVGPQALVTPTRQKRLMLAAIAAAVAGNVVNNLLSFDSTATALSSWLLLGVGIGLVTPRSVGQRQEKRAGAGWRWGLVAGVLLLTGTAVWGVNGRMLVADIAARSARTQLQQGSWEAALLSARQAVAYWPHEPAYHLLRSEAAEHLALNRPADSSDGWREAERSLVAAQQLRPRETAVWLHTAHFYTVNASRPAAAEQADAAFAQAVALAPTHSATYTAWGRSKLMRGELETAVSLLQQAVRLDTSNGLAYYHLGTAEFALGRVDDALGAFGEAVRIQPDSVPAHVGLAHGYWQLNNAQAARRALAEALRHDPTDDAARALATIINQGE